MTEVEELKEKLVACELERKKLMKTRYKLEKLKDALGTVGSVGSTTGLIIILSTALATFTIPGEGEIAVAAATPQINQAAILWIIIGLILLFVGLYAVYRGWFKKEKEIKWL